MIWLWPCETQGSAVISTKLGFSAECNITLTWCASERMTVAIVFSAYRAALLPAVRVSTSFEAKPSVRLIRQSSVPTPVMLRCPNSKGVFRLFANQPRTRKSVVGENYPCISGSSQ